jgi:hypothetical protein
MGTPLITRDDSNNYSRHLNAAVCALRPAVPGEGGEELPLFYPLNYGTMIWKE